MTIKLRLAFMGTPAFAVPALQALIKAGHDIVRVYSQPPRAQGRGQQVQKQPVHQVAGEQNIPVRTPLSLKNAEEQAAFAALDLDAAVVVAYGLLLPEPILNAPRLGCMNIHASLLPRWRGAAPIQRALLAGDNETGITIMQMDKGLDTGGIFLKRRMPIDMTATTTSLHDALSVMGANMIIEALPQVAGGSLRPVPQPADGITYAAKLTRLESVIDWREDAALIERKIRALTPWPGVMFYAKGETIKILAAEIVHNKNGAPPGTLLADDFTVACGAGALHLARVQRQGKAAMDGAAFLRGFSLTVGECL